MMKFLSKEALASVLPPKDSVIGIIKGNLGGPEQPRGYSNIHASEVTKPDFCPRRVALTDVTEKKLPHIVVNTALAVTYDIGGLTQNLVREKWLGNSVVGNWRCLRCQAFWKMSSPPTDTECKGFHKSGHLLRYEEVLLKDSASGLQGSLDALVQLPGHEKLTILEVKIMSPTEWDDLVAPLAEHRLRTCIYLALLWGSPHHHTVIDHAEARILYVSRAHGRKHPDWGQVLPFKEFTVKADPGLVGPYFESATEVAKWRSMAWIPKGVCGSQSDPRAKGCHVRVECFSGKYNAHCEG